MRVQCSDTWASEFGGQGLGYRGWGLEHRVEGLGFRVWDLGFIEFRFSWFEVAEFRV